MTLPAIAYHLTLAVNWPSIQEQGLLSAHELIVHAAQSDPTVLAMLGAHRARRIALSRGVVLNDQAPMSPSVLAKCLVGMTEVAWYGFLNQKVFFWLDRDRAMRFRNASRNVEQVLLVVDVRTLIESYGSRAFVTPINTGFAGRRPAKRGRPTFVSFEAWSAERWKSEGAGLGMLPRPGSHRPVELVIDEGVPHVDAILKGALLLEPGRTTW